MQLDVWSLHKDGKSLILIEGIEVFPSVLTEYRWILSEYPGRGFWISEASSGLRAFGPAAHREAAVAGFNKHYGALSQETLAGLRKHIEDHRELTFQASLRLA